MYLEQKKALKHKRLVRLQCMRSQSLEEPTSTSNEKSKRRQNWITGRQKSYSMDDKPEYTRGLYDENSPTNGKTGAGPNTSI